MHQDVLLSSIFGRPLAITRFACRITGDDSTVATRSYRELQCEHSEFARELLDESSGQDWKPEKVREYTQRLQKWYAELPSEFRVDVEPLDKRSLGSRECPRRKNKSLLQMHQSCNLAIEVHFVLLSLHRSHMVAGAEDVDQDQEQDGAHEQDHTLNMESVMVCAHALHVIVVAQQTMHDFLGSVRASMFWKIVFFTFQSAVTGAYITFLHPPEPLASGALEDLGTIASLFDRMPERGESLNAAKNGLRVLEGLARYVIHEYQII